MKKSEPFPWQLDKSQVEVLVSFDAKITGEKKTVFQIEFAEPDGTIVEATLPKREFRRNIPHKVGIGTEFWVVLWRLPNVYGPANNNISVWPVAKYWHDSWRIG